MSTRSYVRLPPELIDICVLKTSITHEVSLLRQHSIRLSSRSIHHYLVSGYFTDVFLVRFKFWSSEFVCFGNVYKTSNFFFLIIKSQCMDIKI